MKLIKGVSFPLPIFIFGIILILCSCSRNPLKVDISDIKKEVEVVNFSDELFDLQGKDTVEAITALSQEYPDFFNIYTYGVIRIGGIKDETFFDYMSVFQNDSLIRDVKTKTDSVYGKKTKDRLRKDIVKAFKYYQYHFPGKELPVVYTYISGFNQSVVATKNIIGISLDKYLGRNCPYYEKLSNTPQYKIVNMHKDKILSDMVFEWGRAEFAHPDRATNLLENMVEKGKLMYFVDAMLPGMPDSLKIGYTVEQLKWCKANEPAMWTYLIEHKMLYSSKRMNIVRYVNPAPNTSGFPLESPGRTGVWIGWQIIRLYMKKYPDITLQELMDDCDFQRILNESGYSPG